MKKGKQMNLRVSQETLSMRDALVQHFSKTNVIGKVSNTEVIELAIRELYKSYLGGSIPTKSATKERYGAK
jgi:hypothetical protein